MNDPMSISRTDNIALLARARRAGSHRTAALATMSGLAAGGVLLLTLAGAASHLPLLAAGVLFALAAVVAGVVAAFAGLRARLFESERRALTAG